MNFRMVLNSEELNGKYDYEGIDLHKEIFEKNLGRDLSLKEVALMIIKYWVENLCSHHPIYRKTL